MKASHDGKAIDWEWLSTESSQREFGMLPSIG
jgi:hypothetical protein